MSLLNTDMGRELDHMGRFLAMARDYARSKGFKGNFFIEPKPMEPMKHQYDFDSATAIGFLKEYGLDKDFKINIEFQKTSENLNSEIQGENLFFTLSKALEGIKTKKE